MLAELISEAAGVEGWSVAEGPTSYSSDTLWEYVDGIAPRYLAYGFQGLIHVRYQLGDDPLASVTLDLYHMGDELGAFGIYSNLRSPDSPPRPWCVEGHRDGTLAAAWKGPVFVHAEADDQRPALVRMAEHLVSRVCRRAQGAPTLPAILAHLPPEGLVARSQRYTPADLLGYAFLPGGVIADYRFEGRQGRLFFSRLPDRAAAEAAMSEFRAHEERFGELGRELPQIGDGGFCFTGPGLGAGCVVGAGPWVAGAHGGFTNRELESLLLRLVDRL
jgi:hypothetical protein